ncbi:MAG: hypothetical protein U9Q06_01650 [Nanoarchaeota archaeon]|nr:hypothetical protein [Nanoarchaeota archaeon]
MENQNKEKRKAIYLIVNLLISVIAFSFLIGMTVPVVEGELTLNDPLKSLGFKERFSKIKTPVEATTEKTGMFAKFAANNPSKMAVLKGLGWGMTAYMLAGFLGDALGLEESETKAIQYALGVGVFAAKSLSGMAATEGGLFASEGTLSFLGSNPMVTGLVIGAVIFIMMYKKVKYKTITFECQPWEAPYGGENCEKCNDDLEICTEYRCKSLGQACGFKDGFCFDAYKGNVNSPAIQPWREILTAGHIYIPHSTSRPVARGIKIEGQGIRDKCIKAFTPIEFGIQTDMPASCKIGLNATSTYNEMEYHFGGSTSLAYNHSQVLSLPSPEQINDFAEGNSDGDIGELEIQNDGVYDFYVRCISPNGYYNRDPYLVHFCVDPSPDSTPPIIEELSIEDGAPVQYEVDEVPITVFTNEPANCKWSRTDLNFENMENEMTCASSLLEMTSNNYYKCEGTLTSIKDREDNLFYFRCEDQPWKPKVDRNFMSESKKLTLRGTEPLNIKEGSVNPEDGTTISGANTVIVVNLELETENGESGDGKSECFYSLDNEQFIKFKESDSHKHLQDQSLSKGVHTYYFRCIDLGGNQASANTTFEIYVDNYAPIVVRVLAEEGSLKINTDEDAECYYSVNENTGCNYGLDDEGIELMRPESTSELTAHFARWEFDQTYYVKCADKNGKQPNPTQCSIVIRPVEIKE